ncbi:hypothetical protein V6N13_128224 [Hibiscus sabdariffa]
MPQGSGIGAQRKERKERGLCKKVQVPRAEQLRRNVHQPVQDAISSLYQGCPRNTDFEDMSCEMIFGQDPPAPNDDPALKQPCYKLCKANQMHTVKSSG